MKRIVLILFLNTITLTAFAQETNKDLIIEIDFGGRKPTQIYQIKWEEGMTAQAALQYSINISTTPVNKTIFVSEVDGVKNIPYEMGWYYEINGQMPGSLACSQPVKKGDTIKWMYKKDLCSQRSDAITIEIRFGENERPKQVYKIDWTEHLTVMNALQHFVPVETYPFESSYLFVSVIDNKRSIRNESFWAYFINGEKAQKLAMTQLLNKGDHIIWEFRFINQTEKKPIYNE